VGEPRLGNLVFTQQGFPEGFVSVPGQLGEGLDFRGAQEFGFDEPGFEIGRNGKYPFSSRSVGGAAPISAS